MKIISNDPTSTRVIIDLNKQEAEFILDSLQKNDDQSSDLNRTLRKELGTAISGKKMYELSGHKHKTTKNVQCPYCPRLVRNGSTALQLHIQDVHGAIAQSAEQQSYKLRVDGSIPSSPTNIERK